MYSNVKQSSSSFCDVVLTKYTQKSGISWKLSREILSFTM